MRPPEALLDDCHDRVQHEHVVQDVGYSDQHVLNEYMSE
jgi:hypothetical protein